MNAALLAGEPITFCGPRAVFERHFGALSQIVHADRPEAVATARAVLWDVEGALPDGVEHLDITSKAYVLGIGCRRGVEPLELRFITEGHLSDLGLRPENIAAVASCDLKADEPAILELVEKWHVPARFYDAATLDAVPVPTPSDKVREKIGTRSVSEAAALLGAGYAPDVTAQPHLYAPKAAFGDVTLALARLPHVKAAPKRGGLVVVGLGSGAPGHLTPETEAALRGGDVVAGYVHYVDFIRHRIHGKAVIENGMRGEVERCRAALEAAAAGKDVCMVCSGDPGILAMAGLLYELRDREEAFSNVPIRVLPGITAANIAAASLGAPLQNGFSLVSLSDSARARRRGARQSPGRGRLRPARGALQSRRPQAAASALRGPRHLPGGARRKRALRLRARRRGRPEESKWMGRLADFPADEVDMSTLVLVGGPRTVLRGGAMYEARGYVEKYLEK